MIAVWPKSQTGWSSARQKMWCAGCKGSPEARRLPGELDKFSLYVSFHALRLRAIFFRTTAQVGRVRKDSR